MSRPSDAAKCLALVRGREKSFDEPGEYYEATIVVRMQTVARPRNVEDDVRLVADRATLAAAGAYNYHSTRITSVRLVEVKRDGD